MIFHFDLTAAQAAASSAALLCGCVTEAVRAQRLGQHLIIMNREVADYFESNLDLNSLERATLRRLRSDYTQTANLLRQTPTYVRIADLPPGTIRKMGGVIEISIDQAVCTSLYDKMILLVEDEQTDGRLLQFILENLKSKIVGRLPLSFQPLHGGGERIADVARARAVERRLVCVIVDTDKKFPGGNDSLKMRRLNAVLEELSWPMIFVHPTPCKETENLIPIEVISMVECARERGDDISLLARINDVERRSGASHHDAFWLYFDVKEGCDHVAVAALPNLPEKEWILGKIAQATSDREFKVAGFGGHVVPQVLNTNTACARFRAELQSRDWWQTFGAFVSDVAWLTIAGARQFT